MLHEIEIEILKQTLFCYIESKSEILRQILKSNFVLLQLKIMKSKSKMAKKKIKYILNKKKIND